jgi:hypothetical protein
MSPWSTEGIREFLRLGELTVSGKIDSGKRPYKTSFPQSPEQAGSMPLYVGFQPGFHGKESFLKRRFIAMNKKKIIEAMAARPIRTQLKLHS